MEVCCPEDRPDSTLPGNFGVITKGSGVGIPEEICQCILAEFHHLSAELTEKKEENNMKRKKEQPREHLSAWDCPRGHYLSHFFSFSLHRNGSAHLLYSEAVKLCG